jgi:hypothetical protein
LAAGLRFFGVAEKERAAASISEIQMAPKIRIPGLVTSSPATYKTVKIRF